jgi:hypothetical protein
MMARGIAGTSGLARRLPLMAATVPEVLMAVTAPVPSHTLAPGRSPAADALARFDVLERGDTLHLRASVPLRPVLQMLRAVRRGQFEWTPLSDRPDCWEAEVQRRESGRGGRRRLEDVLAWDHRRLDALQQAAFAAHDDGQAEAAWALYRRFADGLRRHVRIEETVVLPWLKHRLGLDDRDATISVVTMEHRAIGTFLDRVCALGASALRDGGPAQEFAALLARHERGEDAMVNHRLADLLDEESSDALAAAVQDVPAQA